MTKNDAFAQRMVGFALDRGWKPKEEDLAPFMERMVVDLEKSVRITVDRQAWTGERIKGLCEAIWPGKPRWTPTAEKPQQDFYEAVVESLRFPTKDDGKQVVSTEDLAELVSDTALRCIEIVDKMEPGTMFMLDTIINRIRREFGLKATPKSDSTASTTHENPKSDKLTSCPTDLD